MKLFDTPGTKLWLKRRHQASQISGLVEGSPLFQDLLRSGVKESELARFIRSGNLIKVPVPRTASENERHVRRLVERGGSVAGGCALREYTFRETSGDTDVFFGDFLSFARSVVESTTYPKVDVCLYDTSPYESFDLTAPMIARSSSGFDVSPECEKAIATGVCEIRPDWIFHPAATIRRVAKYGEVYGMRFKATQVQALASFYGVRDDLVRAALAYAD